jgi:hypothetical protein
MLWYDAETFTVTVLPLCFKVSLAVKQCRRDAYQLFFFVVKGPAADATDAPQP